ncbi:MAG: photosynthetic reaction center cytochrome c subunit family protein [Bryobacteraceae bacterium]
MQVVRSNKYFLAIILTGSTFFASTVNAQVKRDTRPAEQVFKNVTAMKGIPADEFMTTMGFLSASLGISCVNCHGEASAGNWPRYADENDMKRKTRGMIAMVNAMNKSFFGGQRRLTCYTCHRGSVDPEMTPDLTKFYSTLVYREPDKLMPPFPNSPEPGAVWDRFLNAIGGTANLSKLTSVIAKGTFQTYGVPKKFQMEVYAQAPMSRAIVVHNVAGGDVQDVTDGKEAWVKSHDILTPLPIMDRTGGETNITKAGAALMFPAQVKTLLTQWRVAPPATLNDIDYTVVQGTLDGKIPFNFYFNDETGLLDRVVSFADSVIGYGATQVDYADYRTVGNIKVPHKIILTWLDNKAILELTELQPNAKIDPKVFAHP